MKDEKRQTRLLPFRLRREASARGAAFDPARDARDFAARDEESSGDAELTALLREWEAPAPSAGSRERLLAEFRSTVRPAPLWRRAFSAELRVPLPVAACTAVALLASLFALATRATTQATQASASAVESRAVETPAVKVVEVPVEVQVERERVVTRYVYVRDERAAEARRLAAASRGDSAQSTAGAAGARQGSNTRAPESAQSKVSDSQSSGEPTSYYTSVDMADFQPSDEIKMRIVSRRGKTDEK